MQQLLACAIAAVWLALLSLLGSHRCCDDITLTVSCALEMEEGIADANRGDDDNNDGKVELTGGDWACLV
jgi:hypothetical protein